MTQCSTECPDSDALASSLEQLAGHAGPLQQYCLSVLKMQCRLGPAEAGAVLRVAQGTSLELVALYPSVAPHVFPPPWLFQAGQSMGRVLREAKTVVRPLAHPEEDAQHPRMSHLVLIPLCDVAGRNRRTKGVAVFVLDSVDPTEIQLCRERLELTAGLIHLHELRTALRSRELDLARLKLVMETVAAVGEHMRFAPAAIRLCNEIAARWRCDRVCLGFSKGHYIELQAMSHTEHFARKMQLVQDIEAAMEECLDQDIEVVYPTARDATYVSRAAAYLSQRHGPSAVFCLPLRRNGEPFAIVTAERFAGQPLSSEEIHSLRLNGELCTARLADLFDHSRWFGARFENSARTALAGLLGSTHTWMKLAAVCVMCAIYFVTLAKTDYCPEATFALEATRQQVVVAPFDGYLRTAPSTIGSPVEAHTTVLATLETAEIELKLAANRAEKASYLKQEAVALRDGDTAEAQMARAQVDKVAAQIDLFEHRIRQAIITSNMSGVVVSGDLQRQLGAPVKTGDVLFEVAQLESLRAELSLPEDQISDIHSSFRGELATASYPGIKIPFVIERIDPVAKVVNERNVFKVRARLLESYDWMRPGMEGVARITVGRRSYTWVWTQRLANWLRMKLWL